MPTLTTSPRFPNGTSVLVTGGVTLSGGSRLNQAHIGHDLPKLQDEPQGWRELDGYRERWREDDMVATRVFNGPWGQRKTFVDWLLGYSTTIVDPVSPNTAHLLSRVIPAQHPEYPWIYATEVEELTGVGAWTHSNQVFLQAADGNPVLQPFPGAGVLPVPLPMIHYYDSSTHDDSHSCTMRVTYRHRDYEVRADADAWAQPTKELSRYVSRFFQPAIQSLPLSRLSAQLFFKEGPVAGTNIPEGGVRLLPTMQLQMVWHQVPDIPWDAFAACTGKINSKAFDGAPGYRSYPAGTLLCQAPQVKRMRSVVGRVIWEITYRFDYRGSITAAVGGGPATWNHFPNEEGKFYLAGHYPGSYGANVTPTPVYAWADFDQLFVPPAPTNYQ